MPNIACPVSIHSCECLADPVRNFSAELPDKEVFLGIRTFRDEIKINECFTSLECKQLCESEISQEDADDCALRHAFECVHHCELRTAGGGGGGALLFYNTAQSCTVKCPAGQTFTWTVAANTIVALSVYDANQQAYSLACNRANKHKICITVPALPCACINEGYSQFFTAHGGTPGRFSDCDEVGYSWEITGGALPNGMELDPCTGEISGQPTESGSFNFTVRATDSLGSFQVASVTLTVLEISPASPLPDATKGTAYNQALDINAGHPETESWSVVAGTLPDGLSLSEDGIITGTPTVSASYDFTVEVEVQCP